MSDDFTDEEWAEWERDQWIDRTVHWIAGSIPGAYRDDDDPVDVDAEIQLILDGLTHDRIKQCYQGYIDARQQLVIDRDRFKHMAARQKPSTAWHRLADDERTCCGKLHQDWEGGEWFPPPGSGKVCANCMKYR